MYVCMYVCPFGLSQSRNSKYDYSQGRDAEFFEKTGRSLLHNKPIGTNQAIPQSLRMAILSIPAPPATSIGSFEQFLSICEASRTRTALKRLYSQKWGKNTYFSIRFAVEQTQPIWSKNHVIRIAHWTTWKLDFEMRKWIQTSESWGTMNSGFQHSQW